MAACARRWIEGCRVVGVGLRMHVGLGRRGAVDSRGRCGESCILTLLRVRFAWQVGGIVAIGGAARVLSRDRRGDPCTRRGKWCDLLRGRGIVFRGRRRESCAAHETAGFRGPVREIACVCEWQPDAAGTVYGAVSR